jgi:hypothetical protein
MYGDFSRLTFRPDLYTAVFKQQGRVELDADANENTAILLNTVRRLAADVIGRHGGVGDSFSITRSGQTVSIGPGVYYVDGIRVWVAPRPNGTELTFANQPYMFFEEGDDTRNIPLDTSLIVYLRVWEQARSAVEDPSMREKALGIYGPDTSLRTRLIWQVRWVGVKFGEVGEGDQENPDLITGLPLPPGNVSLAYRTNAEQVFYDWVQNRYASGRLAAQVERPNDTEDNPCVLDPNSRYRGLENHLYRVEVHSPGRVTKDNQDNLTAEGLTFKWSRDNGSVIFPILAVTGREFIVGGLGRDERCSLAVGDWVEVVDDAYLAHGKPLPLRQVTEVDFQESRVVLDEEPAENIGANLGRAPLLRRWDQHPVEEPEEGQLSLDENDNAIRVDNGDWLPLEYGVQVRFDEGSYFPGQYWLIAARVFDGNIEWPMDDETPVAIAPHGPGYHYAPLALNAVGTTTRMISMRRKIAQASFG